MESDDRMDGSPVLIGLLIFLVCCSAFFSASETALTSLSRIRLRKKCGFDYASVGRPEPLAEFHSGWE